MQIIKATGHSREAIVQLLQSQNLPAHDLPADLSAFYIALEDEMIGLIGLEQYGKCGLLRSMVVHPQHRNKQVAGSLVKRLEEEAEVAGITTIYLLTETAETYFEKKAYRIIKRDEVPDAVKQSSEFSHVCPVSATVMQKELFQKA